MPLSYSEVRQYSDRKIFATLASIMVVAFVATAIFLYCLNNVLNLRQESIQITKAQTLLDGYYLQLVNAETGQRGFLISGQDAYLEPYTAALKKLPDQGAELEKLSTGLPYARQVKEVKAVTALRLRQLSLGIAARRDQGLEAAAEMAQSDTGKREMDQIRALLEEVSSQQTAELSAKRAAATWFGDWARWISEIMAIGVIVLAGLVYYLFLKAIKSERALDRAKDEFVSLASHQLRTPATGLKSILSMFKARDFGPLNKQQALMIGRAIDSNEREIRIVDELLNVARADAGRLVLKLVELNLVDLMESVASEQRMTIESKDQQLSVRGPGQPVPMMVDEEKLRMAISNLVDNASKYTPEGGRIEVCMKNSARKVCIEVTDTGVGIDKDEQVNIFDRFQRAHGVLMSGVEGTGLGLYLARRIAELHNGTVEVKSKKGRGSTFTLTLPRGEGRHAA